MTVSKLKILNIFFYFNLSNDLADIKIHFVLVLAFIRVGLNIRQKQTQKNINIQ